MIWDGFSMKEYLIFCEPFHNLSIGFFTTGTNHAMIIIDVTGRQKTCLHHHTRILGRVK
jgi:hypothetical protein